MEELYYVPYEQFLKIYPETIRMNDQIRKQRFNFLENIRNSKIQEIKRFRLELLKAESEKEKENKPKTTKRKSVVVEHEEKLAGKEIEIMKKKNDLELAGIVKFELDKDLLLEKVKKENDLLNKQSKSNLNTESNENKDKNEINRDDNYNVPLAIEENTTLAENKFKIIQARKLNDYKLKQIKIEQKLQRISNKKEEKKYKENIKKKQRNDAIQQNLTETQKKNEEKKEKLKRDYQRKELSTYELKKKQFEENLKKTEEHAEMYIQKEDYIEKLRKQDERRRQKLLEKIIEKQNECQKNRDEAKAVIDKKNKDLHEVEKQRNEDIKKAKKILSKGINEETINELNNEFYRNKEIKKVTDDYLQTKKSENEENSSKKNDKKEKKTKKETKEKFYDDEEFEEKFNYNNNISTQSKKSEKSKKSIKNENNQSKNSQIQSQNQSKNNNNKNFKEKKFDDDKILTEEEILLKVKEYKKEQSFNYLALIEEEKEKEKMRIENLNKTKKKDEREKLEKQYGKERTLADLKLKREGDKIEQRIKYFEYHIRNENKEKKKKFE